MLGLSSNAAPAFAFLPGLKGTCPSKGFSRWTSEPSVDKQHPWGVMGNATMTVTRELGDRHDINLCGCVFPFAILETGGRDGQRTRAGAQSPAVHFALSGWNSARGGRAPPLQRRASSRWVWSYKKTTMLTTVSENVEKGLLMQKDQEPETP